MSRFSRSVRIALAALLAVSALTVFGASPASAAATGSLVDNGDGTATLTYSGQTLNENISVLGLPSGTTCTTQSRPPSATFFLTSDTQAPGGAMPSNPFTIQVGTTAYTVFGGSPGPVTIAAGSYNFCVQSYDVGTQVVTVIQQLEVTLGSVAPTTTTTAPAADPVTPAFTG